MLTGKDLIAAGALPGKWFADGLNAANAEIAAGASRDTAIKTAMSFAPPPPAPLDASGKTRLHVNIEADTEAERENVAACLSTMEELLRTPVVKAGALMPDACPAGPRGTIPVGGIAASEAIHPGMHSADICCSMALSVFPGVSPRRLLDTVEAVTHFGPGGRDDHVPMPPDLQAMIGDDPLLKPFWPMALSHFATQGDGNHFAYVGTMKSSGETVLVTHHGSRGPGARLYKAGMALAERHRRRLSPDTLKGNAWIPADSEDGDRYWRALQVVREWTKRSHYAIHDMAAELLRAPISDRFWNEHNFVFRRSDGLFYHGKGATPAFTGWAHDATDLTIIPLNMAEPILIVRGKDNPSGLGFSPHGAGRNFSRTKHKRSLGHRDEGEILAEETAGIDARFYMGIPDISELPSAYKNAASVREQIARFDLAEVVDEVVPYGCIMAGDWERDAPWRKPRP